MGFCPEAKPAGNTKTAHTGRKSHVARKLLQEETLGDPDRFTDKTPIEILEEFTTRIRKEEQEKFDKAFRAQEQSYINALSEKARIEQSIESLAEQISTWGKRIFHVVSVVVLLVVFYPRLVSNDKTFNDVSTSFALGLGLLNVVYGFNIVGLGNGLKEFLKRRVIHLLRGGAPSTSA